MTLFMRDKPQAIFVSTGITMIVVSHDLEGAVDLAHEVLMLARRPTRMADVVTFYAACPPSPRTLTRPEFMGCPGA